MTLRKLTKSPCIKNTKQVKQWKLTAGKSLKYRDPKTKTDKKAYIFVSVLPASSYPYVRAYADMTLKNWVDAHIRAFEFYGGTPKVLIPDNTKKAVLKPDHYDPVHNQTYKEMASHYRVAIIPARPAKPKDKGADEGMVKIVSQRILAALRNKLFSLADVNTALLCSGRIRTAIQNIRIPSLLNLV